MGFSTMYLANLNIEDHQSENNIKPKKRQKTTENKKTAEIENNRKHQKTIENSRTHQNTPEKCGKQQKPLQNNRKQQHPP